MTAPNPLRPPRPSPGHTTSRRSPTNGCRMGSRCGPSRCQSARWSASTCWWTVARPPSPRQRRASPTSPPRPWSPARGGSTGTPSPRPPSGWASRSPRTPRGTSPARDSCPSPAASNPGSSLLAEMIHEPRFDEGEFDRLREERLADILQARSEPGRLADEAFLGECYPDDVPYRRLGAGTPETVEPLTVAQGRAHHERHWRPDRAHLVVAGPVSAASALRAADATFGSLGGVQPGPPAGRGRRPRRAADRDRGSPRLGPERAPHRSRRASPAATPTTSPPSSWPRCWAGPSAAG